MRAPTDRRSAKSRPTRSPKPGPPARVRAHDQLLRRIGARVRALRDERQMPRSALAEASGVSLRFLAQLETGAGNISVARLDDVAHALGTNTAALAAASAAPDAVAASPMRAAILGLLEGRTEAELRELRSLIEARFHPSPGRIIALLGVRGAGKSTVGKRLAGRMNLPFVELDGLIEAAAGLTLAQIFELHGEAYYRRLERETLTTFLASGGEAVLATGGSLVTDRETFRLLRRRATTIWLRARAEDHMARVRAQGDHRPMAANPHAMQELTALLVAREKLYRESHHTVDTSHTPLAEVVSQVLALAQS